jgi:hypothetical protein
MAALGKQGKMNYQSRDAASFRIGDTHSQDRTSNYRNLNSRFLCHVMFQHVL